MLDSLVGRAPAADLSPPGRPQQPKRYVASGHADPSRVHPGWSTDWSPGVTPILLKAGTLSVWENGAVIEGPITMTPPPGLESRLVGPCTVGLLGGSHATFDIEIVDVWMFVPS